ncbi:small acid-soluble spore protein P [Paenibacillus sanguinis]|uniref:small acid-soluble spore protein P n=1 Tax=Paenibacillus sanguinis TaxID=225906 RepID=UPI00036699F4|nr:small acid-soluble spore protein P [Paenibacillus sanguinis]
MTKPQTYQTAGSENESDRKRERHEEKNGQEPLSGSKKVKNQNHVDHHNPQG